MALKDLHGMAGMDVKLISKELVSTVVRSSRTLERFTV